MAVGASIAVEAYMTGVASIVCGASMAEGEPIIMGHLWPWGICGLVTSMAMGNLLQLGICGCEADVVMKHLWSRYIYGSLSSISLRNLC